jgi:alpha-1,6-mannosyltransferase
LGLSPQTRLLVYAGRFAREKNIPVLLATIERLGHPYHLLMIGGRRSERASACVTILPYQRSLERLATLVSSCDAFLHAGDQETYGLVAAEAMACGIPVVGVARGAMPELVDDSVGACAAAPTAAQLAASVASLFDRDIVALGRAAHLRAVTSYSWDGVFRQLISRYAQLTTTARMTSTVAAHARH